MLRVSSTLAYAAEAGRPLLLDPAEAPHGHRDQPRQHEEAYDEEPGLVDVERRHRAPEPAAEVQFGGEQPEHFDAADEHADADGQSGHGEVVVDLAHGIEEGPAVGQVHETAVD